MLAGETLVASTLETRIANLDNPPIAEIRRTASLSIATGSTYNTVTFDDDGSGVRDPFGFWAPSPNPTRITIPAGRDGRYHFRGEMQWEFNATGSRGACFTKNAVSPNATSNGRLGQDGKPASGLTETRCAPEWEDNFIAGDFLELWVIQNSGISLNLAGTSFTPVGIRVYVRRLGAAL